MLDRRASDRRLQPLVGVITPVFNGELYLAECIESVLAQTYANWHLTIVNNCSTDGTLAIANQYAARDPRISVVTNEGFFRVIENHNVAFRSMPADARYCKVVFADDWIFPECLSELVAVAEGNPSVGLVAAYGLYGDRLAWGGLPYPSTVVSGRAIGRQTLLGGPYVFGTATSVLFRADLVRKRHTFFDENSIHADTSACYDVLRDSDLGFVHKVLSFTRTDNDGMTSISRRLNTYITGMLNDLVTAGPHFLGPAELDGAIGSHLRVYYRFLARSAFDGRFDREFWRFHHRRLNDLGHPLSYSRLVGDVAWIVLDTALAFNRWPMGLLRRLGRLFGRRSAAVPAGRLGALTKART